MTTNPAHTPDPTAPAELDPGMVEKARAAFEAMTKAMLDAGRRYEERMNAATTAALSASELVAEVERLRGIERGWQHDRSEWESERNAAKSRATSAEQERDEFERRYSTVLRNLNAAQQERDAWRAVVEAVQTLVMAHTDSDGLGRGWGDVPYGALRTILATAPTLAGSGEQPGEHSCDNCDGIDPDSCMFGPRTVRRPAPVVPDSEGLRVDDDWLHIYWRDPVEGCWVAYRRADCVGEEEVPSGRLLAVVGQGVTAEQAWDEGATKASPHGGAYLRSILIQNPYRAAVRPTGQEKADG